jgi:hypothetical protein
MKWAETFPDDDAFDHITMVPFLEGKSPNQCPCDPAIDDGCKLVIHECLDGSREWEIVDE